MTQRSMFKNPQAMKYLAYKDVVGYEANKHFSEPLSCEVAVIAEYHLFGNRIIDIDNLIKGTLDSLNKIAWIDDKQVVRVSAERIKTSVKGMERVEVQVFPLAN